MLKFSDLSVDMKSYKNSLDSYMKLFPGSYMPLLIMYLSNHSLLDLQNNADENDPRLIIHVAKKDVEGFLGEELSMLIAKWQSSNNQTVDDLKSLFGDDNDRNIMLALVALFNIGKNDNDCYILIKEGASSDIIKIKEIIMRNEPEQKEKASLFFFYFIMYLRSVFQSDESEQFSEFDEILNKLQTYSGDKTWMQPDVLTEIVLSMKGEGPLYNPFAGLASYSARYIITEDDYYNNISLGDDYYGEEIDELTWAIGKLRLLVYETDSKNYTLSDSTFWTDKKFPNIISTPPFGLRIKNEYGKQEYADHFAIRRSIDNMTSDGMAAFVVPASFLTRKDTYELRKLLINEKLLEVVVSLPEGIFSNTNIKTVIIFLSKRDNNTVKFVDASKYYKTEGRVRKLAKKAILNLLLFNDFPYYEYSFDERKVEAIKNEFLASFKFIRQDELFENDYSISVNKYVHQLNSSEGLEVQYLGNIFFPVTKDRDEIIGSTLENNPLETGHYAAFEDLSNNSLVPHLDYASLKYVYYNDHLTAVKGPAILFSLKGELRPTLLDKGQTVFIDKHIIAAFNYDPEEFFGEYIVNELYKPRVKEQLEDMELEIERTPDDIELLNILCPKADPYDWNHKRLQAQKDAMNNEKSRRILNLEKQLSELKDKRSDEYIKSLRQRKHRIQQVMNELCPAFALLDKRRVEKGILHDEDIVGKRTGKTVSDYFKMISDAIEKVENMITHIVDEDEWGESESFKLKDFLKEIANRNLSDRYTIKVNYHINDEYGEDAILVSLNSDKFSTVFENIFANAKNWGFIDSNRNDYCVRIDVDKPSFNTVRIRVANNGEPINPSLDRSRIFEWGIGNHTGYGTWQVKNIIEHYLGTVELNEYPEDVAGFQTEYEIVLPAYL